MSYYFGKVKSAEKESPLGKIQRSGKSPVIGKKKEGGRKKERFVFSLTLFFSNRERNPKSQGGFSRLEADGLKRRDGRAGNKSRSRYGVGQSL